MRHALPFLSCYLWCGYYLCYLFTCKVVHVCHYFCCHFKQESPALGFNLKCGAFHLE